MGHVVPVIVVALLVALGGCRSKPRPATCDLEALAKLGDALAPMSVADQASQVWPGLVDACADAIPKPLTSYFGPMHDPSARRDGLPREREPATASLQRAACPRWDELARANQDASSDSPAVSAFEACGFARYEVLSADEVAGPSPAIMTWATHQWLLDQGLDGGAAAPITRALFALEQIEWSPIERMEGLRLPKAHGVPLRGGTPIYVAREFIVFESGPRIELDEGVLGADNVSARFALEDRFATQVERARELASQRGREWDATFLLVADARIPMATVVGLLHSAERAGFARYGLFVEPEAYVPTYIPVELASSEPQGSAFMRIDLSPEGLRLSRGGAQGQGFEAHELTQLDAVSSFAKAVRRDDPGARRVVVSAEGTIPLGQLLAVVGAVRGPECSETGAGCVLPELVLLGGRPPGVFETDRSKSPSMLDHGGRFAAQPFEGELTVEGALEPSVIDRVVKAHHDEIRACYDGDEPPQNEITVDFVIDTTGEVVRPEVDESRSSSERARSCVVKVVRHWRFPKPLDGREVRVSYPLEFGR